MSHDTHQTEDNKPGSSPASAIWFMIILAFVFISAVNFVEVMGHDDSGHGDAGHATEHAAPAHGEDAHGGHGEAEHGHEEAHH